MKKFVLNIIISLFLGGLAYGQEYSITTSSITTDTGTFVDDGGSSGDYSNALSVGSTIFPATAGEKIRIEFTEFEVEAGYDSLYIFDGIDTNSPVIAALSGSLADFSRTIFRATNIDGALTFSFTSDSSVVRSGWVAQIGLVQEFSITAATITTNSGLFVDDGGSAGTYSNSQNLVSTIYPATTGEKIKVAFTQFDLEEGFDYLYVHDGINGSAPMLAELNGQLDSLPQTVFEATNPEGALTFGFSSDGSEVRAGWVAEISLVQTTATSTPFQATSYYPFTGDATDAIGTDNGTVVGATLSEDRFGNLDQSYAFDGINDQIEVSVNSLNAPSNITLWFKSSQNGPIVSWYEDFSPFGYEIAVDSAGISVHYGHQDPGFSPYEVINTFPGLFNDNLWHQFVLNRGIDSTSLFVDNNRLGAFVNGTIEWSYLFRVGTNSTFNGSQSYFTGQIDDVLLGNGTLTDTQIDSLYTLGGWPIDSATPLVTGPSPSEGLPGAWLGISGENFDSASVANTQVSFGDSLSSVILYGSTILITPIPDMASGSYPLIISIDQDTLYNASFFVQDGYPSSRAFSNADSKLDELRLNEFFVNTEDTICTNYSDFTSLDAFTFASGESINGSVILGTCGGNYRKYFTLWIDYNQDFRFDPESELLASDTATSTATRSFSFVIPETLAAGAYRMRAIVSEGGFNSGFGDYYYGETEDYTLTITAPVSTADYSQLGLDIDGQNADEWLGDGLSISADGNTVVIGAPGSSSVTSKVQVYEWTGSGWIQKGSDINGEALGDSFGASVDISSDGNVLIAGGALNDAAGTDAGSARIFEWNGSAWVQRGNSLTGFAAGDQFGYSVTMNNNGAIVGVGARFNDSNSLSNVGNVTLYLWDGVSWTQLGNPIVGEAASDRSGAAISISDEGDRIAIGAPSNDDAAFNAGHVRLYEWDGTSWLQMGADIDGLGLVSDDVSGSAVSLSPDGSTVAIGAPQNDGTIANSNSGQVRIFRWNGAGWSQLGDDIYGAGQQDFFGESVSLSFSGDTLAAGAYTSSANGTNSGQARIFYWDGFAWNQLGSDINGEAAGDQFGVTAAISKDGSRVAFGGRLNSAGGTSAGHVRVFGLGAESSSISAPTDFVVRQTGSQELGLGWTPDTVNVESYNLYFSTDGGANYSFVGNYLSEGQFMNFTFGPVTAGDAYIFDLEAVAGSETARISTPEILVQTLNTPIVVVSPTEFTLDDQITLTYYPDRSYPVDELVGVSPIYMHSGLVLPGNENGAWDAAAVVGNWGQDDGVGQMTSNGDGSWNITLTPRTYYGVDNTYEASQIGMVFRNGDGSLVGKGDTLSDIYINVSPSSNQGALTAYYTFDAGAGTDQSGNGFDLATVNSPRVKPDRYGSTDASLEFSRESNEYLEVSHGGTIDLTGAITLSAWIRPNEFPGDNNSEFWYTLLSENSFGELNISSSGELLYHRSANTYATGVNQLQRNKWQMVTISISEQNYLKFYVNGQSVGVAANSTINDSLLIERSTTLGSLFFISKNDNGATSDNRRFSGDIDDVRVYTGSNLNAAEIESLYQAETPYGSGNLISYHDFNGTTQDQFNSFDGQMFDVNGNASGSSFIMDRNGNAAGAILFENTGSFMQVNHGKGINLKSEVTVNLWIQLNALPEDGRFGDVVFNGGNNWLMIGSNGELFYHWFDGTNYLVESSPTGLVSAGSWQMISYSLTGDGTLNLYHNGNLVHTATGLVHGGDFIEDFNISSNTFFDGEGDRYLNGAVDDLVVYQSVLNDSEIAAFFDLSTAPSISAFSPTSGPVGTQVVISGQNFSSNLASNQVALGTESADVTEATPTSLTVTVPDALTPGTYAISVTVGSETGQSSSTFEVTETTSDPVISSFSPNAGPAGTIVTVNGSNFTSSPMVFLGGTQTGILTATDTQIEFSVPDITIGSYAIEVSANGASAISSSNYEVTQATGNEILSVSKTAAQGGEIMVIETNFEPVSPSIRLGTGAMGYLGYRDNGTSFELFARIPQLEPGIYSINLFDNGSFQDQYAGFEVLSTTGYPLSGAYFDADTQIDQFTFGDFSNSSENSCASYSEFLSPVIELTQGTTYSGSVDIGSCSAENYRKQVAIFLDLNRNENFEESEMIFISDTSSSPQSVSFNYQIPSALDAGEYRLRVICQETSQKQSYIDPTVEYLYGETEDYAVSLAEQDNTPPSISNISFPETVQFTASVIVEATIIDDFQLDAATVEYAGLRTDFSNVTNRVSSVLSQVGNNFSFTFPSGAFDELGIRFLIRATDLAGNEQVSDILTIYRQDEDVQVSSIPIAGGELERDYKLFALPYQSQNVNAAFEELGSYDNTQWRLFNWNSSSQQYAEYPTFSQFEPGRGYFLIKKNNTAIRVDGDRIEGNFTVDLNSGWNLIGNPYPFDITVSDMEFDNGFVPDFVTYNGSFSSTSTLEAFQGAFVEVSTGGTLQFISDPGMLRVQEDPHNWLSRIQIITGKGEQNISAVGMHTDARIGSDNFDYTPVPALHADPYIHFDDGLTRSIISEQSEFEWNFDLGNVSPGESVTLKWENQDVNEPLYLYDTENQTYVNMRNNTTYTFTYVGNLQIIYGITPEGAPFSGPEPLIEPMYPNPSQARTLLNIYQLAAESEIDVTISTLEGRQVWQKTVMPESGELHLDIDTQSLVKGLYLYTVSVTQGKSTYRSTGRLVKL